MSKLDQIIENAEGYETIEDALIEHLDNYKTVGEVMADLLSRMASQEADEKAFKCVSDLLLMYLDMTV